MAHGSNVHGAWSSRGARRIQYADKIKSIFCAELNEDAVEMAFYGAGGQSQFAGDFLVRKATCNESNNF